MGTAEILELLSAGGHGVAAIMYMFLREERKERIRYRNFHEETLKEYPKVASALLEVNRELKEFKNVIERLIRERT